MGMVPPKIIHPDRDIVVSKSERSVEEDWAYFSRRSFQWRNTYIAHFFVDFFNALSNFFVGLWEVLNPFQQVEPDYSHIKWPVGKSGTIPFLRGYQPIEEHERGDPPRSISAIIPTRCILRQMDEMIDALRATYHVDASKHVFVLSPERYRDFYCESVLHMRYVGDLVCGNVQYRGIPVIEDTEVIGGIVLMPLPLYQSKGGQSNSALIRLMESIQDGINARRSENTSPMPYALAVETVEEERLVGDCDNTDGDKVRPLELSSILPPPDNNLRTPL